MNRGGEPAKIALGLLKLTVPWLGYWLPRLDQSGFFAPDRPAIPQLIDEIVELIRAGILNTSPGEKFGLDDIRAAVTEAESVGHDGKVFWHPTDSREMPRPPSHQGPEAVGAAVRRH